MISEQAEKYLRKCSANGLAERTIENYRLSLTTFYVWWGNSDISCLSEDDIDDYKAYLRKLNYLNSTTVNNRLRDLRVFVKYANSKNWCNNIKIKLISVQEVDVIPFTDNQLKDLYDACLLNKTLDRIRDYVIMRLLEETGIRIEECIGIKLNDINMKEGTIKLGHTKNRKIREAYLTPAMKKELNSYMEARRHFLAKKEIKSDYLWIVTKAPRIGNPIAKRTIQEQIQKYGELAGITIRVSPHTFRHTFARNFIVNGGDMLMLQKLLGHSSLDMVLRYVRLFGKDKQNAYLKIMEKREKDKKKQRQKASDII